MHFTISFRREDTHFAECTLTGTDPVFTPEEAREAVAVSHLAYLAAKKGSVATMAELKDLVATRWTRALFEDLEDVPLKSYEGLRW